MSKKLYKVFVRTRSDGAIIEINSSAFLQDTDGWIEIDAGFGDRYHHAAGNYLDTPIFTEDGIPAYKLSGDAVEARSEAEISIDISSLPPLSASVEDRLNELYDALNMILEGETS